jgi:sigma-B regulation protein RsbU (phosphoserine phosphatase)
MQTAMQDAAQPEAQAADRPVETILVVEDSKVEQVRMLAMLKGFGYRVLTADNGQQALKILRNNSVRLILTDWRMPEISGIDLCREVRVDAAFGQPYLILVTGRNTKTDLVAGMDAGADDFISKPFNGEELRVRVQAGVRLLQLRSETEQRSLQLAAALEREAEANSMLRRDLSVAARMQRESLPTGPSPFAQLQVGSLFRAATEVAGDGYDFFRLDDRHLAFYLIDVAGHGVASAMLSFTVSRFLSPEKGAIALRSEKADGTSAAKRVLPGHIVPPDRVVHALNQRFVEKADCRHYFTMVYGVLDVESGLGELCQAGHPHPLMVVSERKVTRLGAGGFPVGMLEESSYESVAFRLGMGERLVVYSDGITDSRGSDGRQFGEQRLANLLGSIHGQPLADGIDRIDRYLRQWQGDAAGEDDMSLLAIERAAADGPARAD